MDPITIALLAGAAGGAIGSFFGWLFGSSQAQQEIERLQQMVLELHRINKQREAEIRRLHSQVAQLEAEIQEIKANRGFIEGFVRWIIGEQPDVVLRYQEIVRARARAAAEEGEIAANHSRLDAEVGRLRQQYPGEMKQWSERLG